MQSCTIHTQLCVRCAWQRFSESTTSEVGSTLYACCLISRTHTHTETWTTNRTNIQVHTLHPHVPTCMFSIPKRTCMHTPMYTQTHPHHIPMPPPHAHACSFSDNRYSQSTLYPPSLKPDPHLISSCCFNPFRPPCTHTM